MCTNMLTFTSTLDTLNKNYSFFFFGNENEIIKNLKHVEFILGWNMLIKVSECKACNLKMNYCIENNTNELSRSSYICPQRGNTG